MSEVRLTSFRGAMAALDAEREARNLSVQVLAAMAGTTDSSLYAWRSNRRAPTLDSVISLAGVLGFELVMRPKGGNKSNPPRHFLAHVLELREPVTVDGHEVGRLVFRRLKGGALRKLGNPDRCASDLIAATTGLPLEAADSLCDEDRIDAVSVLTQLSEMVRAI